MQTSPITYKSFYSLTQPRVCKIEPLHSPEFESGLLVSEFCKSFSLPEGNRNYSTFDENLAKKIATYKNAAIKPVTDMLQSTDDEKNATAGLYLLNRIIDAGADGTGSSYHLISKFNYNESPNIQTMLAGIYRKTQVPDAFGPLVAMFLKNAQNPVTKPFDPNEEIGGAILEYLRSKSAVSNYS